MAAVTALLAAFWPGLAAAALLGTGVGLLVGRPRNRVAWLGLAALLVALTALGAVAILGPVAGRAGLWIEVAALMLASYLVGGLPGLALAPLIRRAP